MTPKPLARRAARLLPPFGESFVSVEAASALALAAGAVAAVTWATLGDYEQWWSSTRHLGAVDASPRAVVNDGLMCLFFLLVGLELKRELVLGELRDRRAAVVPVAAALGGLAVPAVLLGVLAAGTGMRGWTIPLATDVALPLGILALLGDRVPRAVRLFLLELAIVDDLGTVLLVAVLYGGLQISATIIGVGVAWALPVRRHGRPTRVGALERALLPWVSFGVVPLFALANAGLALDHRTLELLTSRVTAAVVVALVVGKVSGVTGGAWLMHRFGPGRLPADIRLGQLLGVAALAAMSFTVSLYVATVAFHGEALDSAKLGLFVGSALGGALGASWLSLLARRARRHHDQPGRDATVARGTRP
jgi:NhaA family Na+:H+ antiporter